MNNTLLAKPDDVFATEDRQTGDELRDTERAITLWQEKAHKGGSYLFAAFDSFRHQEAWGYRFLISAESCPETAVFIIYGLQFAFLLKLPEKPSSNIPLLQQLPSRHRELFAAGCGDAVAEGAPIRFEGAAVRCDGKLELYRAAFMPVRGPHSVRPLIFGSFNCRAVMQESASAARNIYARIGDRARRGRSLRQIDSRPSTRC